MYATTVAEAIADIGNLNGYNLWAGECTDDALMVMDGLTSFIDKSHAFDFIKFWIEQVSIAGPKRGVSVLALVRPDGEVVIEERINPEKAIRALANVDRWNELAQLQPDLIFGV